MSKQPIVIICFSGIGDFVRSHSVVQLLRARFPDRPIDVVTRSPAVDLAALMPEVRAGFAERFRHNRLSLAARVDLATTLRRNGYGTAVVLPRTWKAAITPFLAGIPERIGWFGEFRFPLINRPRFGDRRLQRMIDQIAALGLEAGAKPPREWPEPNLSIPDAPLAQWRKSNGVDRGGRPVVIIAPCGAADYRTYPAARFVEVARWCVEQGLAVSLVGAANEKSTARYICNSAPEGITDFTGEPLIDTACRISEASLFVGNDSGLMHVAAALGRPTIGIFGYASPFVHAPINKHVITVEPEFRIARDADGPRDWPPVSAVCEAIAGVIATTRHE